jgi:4-hydroxybenzoate polyprenyltransferase
MLSRVTSLRPWLELLRLPNLPTVPGDPLVGAVLAGAAGGIAVSAPLAAGVALASLSLYMAGLILNDLHDLPDDRLHRPERPLVQGAIRPRTAGMAFGLASTAGLLAAAWAGGLSTATCAAALLGLVCVYDLWAKARPASACLVMGLCRGFSMMLGACAMGRPEAVALPALALTAYIAGVTWLSRSEDETQRPGPAVLLPPLAMLGGCLAVGLQQPPGGWLGSLAFLGSAALAVAGASRLSLGLFRQAVAPGVARAAVGQFIGLLLPWQAAAVVCGGTPGATATTMVLLAAWPLSRLLARRVSPS